MKLMLKITGGIILAVVLLVAGCSALVAQGVESANKEQEWTVRVIAPEGASWSGAFGDSTVDGTGARDVKLKDSWVTAANAQKQDDGAWKLTLQLVDQDGNVVDESSTSAAYGVASVSGTDL